MPIKMVLQSLDGAGMSPAAVETVKTLVGNSLRRASRRKPVLLKIPERDDGGVMNHNSEVEDAIFEADHEDLVPRLILLIHHLHGLDSEAATAVVLQAYDEVLRGLHRRHYYPTRSLFSFLCAVIGSIVAAQTKPKQRRPSLAALKDLLRRWQIRSRDRHW
jgi:hypothetical protein